MNHYTINSRILTTVHSIEKELNLDRGKNYLFDLSYLTVLRILGQQALSFLQGQLTCDVSQVSPHHIMRGAQCNLKGRILSLVDIVLWGEVLLILPQDLLSSTQTTLSKTALLSRVSLEEQHQIRIYGFYLQNPKDLMPTSYPLPLKPYEAAQDAHSCIYHLDPGFYLLLIKHEKASALEAAFLEQDQLLGSLTWHTLQLKLKHINIYPESRGLFLPHRLDLHQTEYLSFNKGCYKGQEIIARTHYKAQLKHELRIFQTPKDSSIYSGQKLMDPQGEIIDYSYLSAEQTLIAASVLK